MTLMVVAALLVLHGFLMVSSKKRYEAMEQIAKRWEKLYSEFRAAVDEERKDRAVIDAAQARKDEAYSDLVAALRLQIEAVEGLSQERLRTIELYQRSQPSRIARTNGHDPVTPNGNVD